LNQLEKILEVTGRPSKLDMKSIKSKHTQTMIDGLQVKNQRTLQSLFPTAPPDALDLLNRLLQFNPDRRATIEQAISHPYLAQFHSAAEEPVLAAPIAISIDDNKRLKISEYRKYLYKKIVERKKQLRKKREMAQAAAALAAGQQQPSQQPGGSPSGSTKPSRVPSATHTRQPSAGSSAAQYAAGPPSGGSGQRSAAAAAAAPKVASSSSASSLPPANNAAARTMQSSSSAASVVKKR
jgi:mitogen-activated protein kinase 15